MKKQCVVAQAAFLIAIVQLLFSASAAHVLGADTPAVKLPSRDKVINLLSKVAFGSETPQISTFNGWTMWMGWDGSFSETYTPQSETFYWMVYFAPEGLFVALQSAKSNYSNVDTYAAIDHFFGILQSPFGPLLPRAYLNSLQGVTISINAFDSSFVPTGPLSQLSMAITSGRSYFKMGSLKALQRGIQYNSGLSVSFALLPFSLPFSVSIDYESSFVAGFYPIILWDIDASSGEYPVDLVLQELRSLSEHADTSSFPGYYEKEIADLMIPFLETLPSAPQLREFVTSTSHNSHIDTMIRATQDWLRTGDTSKLPASVDLPEPPAEQYETMRPVKTITDMCFELGYEHGYRSTNRTDTIYADCVTTVHCRPAEDCSLEVTAEEIAGLIPDSQPADFEGVDVGFDTPPESQLAGGEEIYWTTIESGKASFTFVNNTDTPLLLGVQVYPSAATDYKTIELCRRKVVFEETFVVPETDYDDIQYDNQTISCAAASVLGTSERAGILPELRLFRDTILVQTKNGKQLTALYYRLSPAVVKVLKSNPTLHRRSRNLLLQLMPYIQHAQKGNLVHLPFDLRQNLKLVMNDIMLSLPQSLRQDMQRALQLIEDNDRIKP